LERNRGQGDVDRLDRVGARPRSDIVAFVEPRVETNGLAVAQYRRRLSATWLYHLAFDAQQVSDRGRQHGTPLKISRGRAGRYELLRSVNDYRDRSSRREARDESEHGKSSDAGEQDSAP